MSWDIDAKEYLEGLEMEEKMSARVIEPTEPRKFTPREMLPEERANMLELWEQGESHHPLARNSKLFIAMVRHIEYLEHPEKMVTPLRPHAQGPES